VILGQKKFVSTNSGRNQHTTTEAIEARQLELESARQAHHVVRVNLILNFSQPWQIFSIYIDKRSFGVHVVSVHRRGVINERSLRLGNDGKTVNRFLYCCNELIVIERVFPRTPNEEWVGSLARLASGWGREG